MNYLVYVNSELEFAVKKASVIPAVGDHIWATDLKKKYRVSSREFADEDEAQFMCILYCEEKP